jgi:threonyl-tRNA synthetase
MNLLENKNRERETSNADHRLIGQQLDLFSINEQVGIGLVLWHPNGTIVRKIVRDFWEEEHLKNGYQLVCTPHIAREDMWRTSGHLDYYEQNMYVFEKDAEKYVVKPMNCPLHIQIYKAKPRSYRDPPIRYAEWGTVYRYERSGTLQGLLRVRGFTQDDAHIFCAHEQVKQELLKLLDFTQYLLRKFGFKEYHVYLSTRDPQHPEKYMGSEQKWRQAQNALVEALKERRIAYREILGEAVFYGPKIDINIVDSAGRELQCTTIQFDFNLPKRFNISYVGTDGREHEVVMIHRALLGAIERFFAILTEHSKGNFPVWLAPVQVEVLPVSIEYAE